MIYQRENFRELKFKVELAMKLSVESKTNIQKSQFLI